VFAELHAKDGPTQGIHRSATPFFHSVLPMMVILNVSWSFLGFNPAAATLQFQETLSLKPL
jgi:hypothetical protein